MLQGLETNTFKRAIELEDERIAAINDWSRFRFAYRTLGHYATFIRPWLEGVGRSDLHIVFLEDLVRNPESVATPLFDHIDLDISDIQGIVLPHMNKRKHVRFMQLHRLANRCMNFRPQKTGIGERSIRRIGRSLRKLNIEDKAPEMPEMLRLHLMETYKASDSALEEMLNRVVPWRK